MLQQFIVVLSVVIGVVTCGFTITFLIGIADFQESAIPKWVSGILIFVSIGIIITQSTVFSTGHLLFFIAVGLIHLAMIVIPIYQKWRAMAEEHYIALVPQERALGHSKHHGPLVEIPNELLQNIGSGGTQEIQKPTEVVKIS